MENENKKTKTLEEADKEFRKEMSQKLADVLTCLFEDENNEEEENN